MKTLLSEELIKSRVEDLGDQITKDFHTKNLLCICILKGSVLFFADLIRNIGMDLQIGFLKASSYEGQSSTGKVTIHDFDLEVEGKDLLLVEDIIDTGLTLNEIVKYLQAKNPRSISIVTLLNKECKRKIKVPVKYSGYVISDLFVVGYGLDLDEKYRNLPYIGVME